jgi:hypothetical protein
MSEKYANAFATQLASSMFAGDLSAQVAAAAPAALWGGQFRIAVDAELMLVTAGASTTTWTVTRGVEGTVAAGHTSGSAVTHVLTAASLLGASGVLDVRTVGATGDGATDDTAALQAAFSALAPLATGVVGLYFPPGTYLVSDTLDVPYVQYRHIFGAGVGVSVIRMTASNKPIIRAGTENTHTISIDNLTLQFSVNQAKTNTSAYGLLFTASAGAGSGFYYWDVRRVAIEGAAVGIGIGGSGAVPVWGTTFDTIRISNTSLHAIDLTSPSVIGMPNVLFRAITIANTGAGITTSEWCVRTQAVEASFDGLDIEDWEYYGALYITGGAPVLVRALHVERHKHTTTNATLINVADGPVMFELGSIDGTTTVGGGVTAVFKTEGAATLSVRGITGTWTNSGGAVGWLGGDPAAGRIWAQGNIWAGTTTTEYLSSGYGTDLYCRVSSDGLPPVVDTLPTGAAVYRGRRFRVLGGAGVADVVSECAKNAADAYVWVTK